MPDFDDICDAVQSGKVILFLGAGVHASPDPEAKLPWVYPDAQRPLFAGELAEHLAKQSGWAARFDAKEYPPKRNFTRVTLDYELNIEKDLAQQGKGDQPQKVYPIASPNEARALRDNGRKRLANEVKRSVSVNKVPSPALKGLAELNFPIIVTTNYDDLFTNALLNHGKSPTTEHYQPGVTGRKIDPTDDPTVQQPFVFKIHGCINNPQSMVITDEDYIDFVLNMSKPRDENPVPETIYHRLARWPTLFIGYSLMDYNLRLLLKTLRAGRDKFKTCHAIDPWPDSLITRVWDDELQYVSFVAEDLWTFVPKLYQRIKGSALPL